ncbi:peptidoglycan D,D-transpeptidase FtsI family protein [Saccharospirillum salsuginis]|uniref:Peptidoglycan D,D-transpeptidase FtsI n=1 Tax=Saccharospirillum salsuginis TaxID=418750 RepID=A0A918N843_9GAMM|nr:penicillin-binding protein 2 [Saccharospirillum salsuginis]GGX46654.1 penicillin-binding protein 3 [Saccharospirillum salsuginis]
MLANWRFYFVQTVLVALLAIVVWRVVGLQVLEKDFLIEQGTSRWQRLEVINAPRGMLSDRHGEPVAVSTPVVSVWADPRELREADIPRLAEAADVSAKTLQARRQQHRAFMYINRHMTPDEAERILSRNIRGVYGLTEYKRYYPAGEVAAHVVGFTDIDDHGQEGVELAFENQLRSESGKKEVIRDLLGRSVRDVGLIEAPKAGQDLRLTIDLRLQYLAYRELKKAVTQLDALAGSVVIMDVRNGDVLAMVNQPGFNPNNRAQLNPTATRNRAMTDQAEPGSVMKPISMAVALSSQQFSISSTIDTNPGYLRVGDYAIRDFRNYGVLDMTGIITKSSNVGIAKVAQQLDGQRMWETLYGLGFGQTTGIGYPGEAAGRLPNPMNWHAVDKAAMSYGYGLAVTPLQLAQAYATLANDGRQVNARILMDTPAVIGEQVVPQDVARQVLGMMETVVEPKGTGTRAALDWFSVAGKTGTTHKVGAQGYEDEKYMASFVGIAPADEPRIVAVIVINEPPTDAYFGGEAAAPVFRGIMTQALPLLGVQPDRIPPQARLGGDS